MTAALTPDGGGFARANVTAPSGEETSRGGDRKAAGAKEAETVPSGECASILADIGASGTKDAVKRLASGRGPAKIPGAKDIAGSSSVGSGCTKGLGSSSMASGCTKGRGKKDVMKRSMS